MSAANKAEEKLCMSCWGQRDVTWARLSWFMNEDRLEMISMPAGDALTWFLCGGVDGCRLRPGASCIESSHREVVHCVRFQPCDVNQRVVSRYVHFANSVRLGVVFPVHNLLVRTEKPKKTTEEVMSTDTNTAWFSWCISLHYWNSYSITKSEMLFVQQKEREGATMNNTFFTSGVSITDAHPLSHSGYINKTLVGHRISDPGRQIHDYCSFCSIKQAQPLILSEESETSVGKYVTNISKCFIGTNKSPLSAGKPDRVSALWNKMQNLLSFGRLASN